jgi:hypothetical protein
MLDDLPIARTTTGDLVVDAEGAPLWPVRDATDAEDLERLAAVFGRSLEERDAKPGTATAGSEVVLGLGTRFTHAAELYAHLTARTPRIVDSVHALDEHPDAKVLLCAWSDLSFAFLERVWRRGCTHGPLGLVVADDEASMRRQVLLRSAAARLQAPAASPVVLVVPDFDIDEETRPGTRILGSRASALQVASALGAGAGVAATYVHSDGLDTHLGHGKVLCGLRSWRDRNAPQPPDCVASAFCHRLQLPLDEAARDERMLDASQLRAGIGLVLTCFGIPAVESMVAWQWSLLASRLEGGTVGAVVTTWGLTTRGHGAMLHLSEELAAGRTVGEAVAASNELLGEHAMAVRLCLFGDPRTRASRSEASVAELRALREALAPKRRRAGAAAPSRTAALRRLLVMARAQARPGADEAAIVDAALAAPENPSLVLRAIASAKAYQLLTGLADAVNPIPCHDVCPWCATPLRAFLHELHDGPRREERWCDRCGVVQNSEYRGHLAPARFAVRDGRLVVDATLRAPDVSAIFVVEPPPAVGTPKVPRYVFDIGARHADPRLPLGTGAQRCTVLALKDAELVLLQGSMRPEGILPIKHN